MLEVKNLMVFYENAIAINNINMKCEQGEGDGCFWSQQCREIYPDVYDLGNYIGCKEKGRNERRGDGLLSSGPSSSMERISHT